MNKNKPIPLFTFNLNETTPIITEPITFIAVRRTSNKVRFFFGLEGKEIFQKKCTCGCWSTYGEDSNLHTGWCDIKL